MRKSAPTEGARGRNHSDNVVNKGSGLARGACSWKIRVCDRSWRRTSKNTVKIHQWYSMINQLNQNSMEWSACRGSANKNAKTSSCLFSDVLSHVFLFMLLLGSTNTLSIAVFWDVLGGYLKRKNIAISSEINSFFGVPETATLSRNLYSYQPFRVFCSADEPCREAAWIAK